MVKRRSPARANHDCVDVEDLGGVCDRLGGVMRYHPDGDRFDILAARLLYGGTQCAQPFLVGPMGRVPVKQSGPFLDLYAIKRRLASALGSADSFLHEPWIFAAQGH